MIDYNDVKDVLLSIYSKSKSSFVSNLENSLVSGNQEFIITANAETLSYCKDEYFLEILNNEKTTIVADGISILKMANDINYNIEDRITGVYLTQLLFELASKHNKDLAIIGSSEDVSQKIESLIYSQYPGINLVLRENGYVNDMHRIMNDVVDKQPNILLVALGIPKQEKLIYKYLGKLDNTICMGIGGSFDVISGVKKRAPKFIQRIGFEWLYRIISEPQRLKRFWENNIKFYYGWKRWSRKRVKGN